MQSVFGHPGQRSRESFRAEGQYAEARRLYRKASATLDGCVNAVGVSPDPSTRGDHRLNEASVTARWETGPRRSVFTVHPWTCGRRPRRRPSLRSTRPRRACGGDDVPRPGRGQTRLNEQVLASGVRHSARPTQKWRGRSPAWPRSPGRPVEMPPHHDSLRRPSAESDRSGAGDEPDRFAQALELRDSRRAGPSARGSANLEKALSERSASSGRTHPSGAQAAPDRRGRLCRRVSGACLAAALNAERDGRDHLRFTMRYLPERVALAYAAKRPRGLDLALSIAATGRAPDVPAVFDAVVRSRGVILDELASRARSNRHRRSGGGEARHSRDGRTRAIRDVDVSKHGRRIGQPGPAR